MVSLVFQTKGCSLSIPMKSQTAYALTWHCGAQVKAMVTRSHSFQPGFTPCLGLSLTSVSFICEAVVLGGLVITVPFQTKVLRQSGTDFQLGICICESMWDLDSAVKTQGRDLAARFMGLFISPPNVERKSVVSLALQIL